MTLKNGKSSTGEWLETIGSLISIMVVIGFVILLNVYCRQEKPKITKSVFVPDIPVNNSSNRTANNTDVIRSRRAAKEQDVSDMGDLMELALTNHHICALSLMTNAYRQGKILANRSILVTYTVEYNGQIMHTLTSAKPAGGYQVWMDRLQEVEARPVTDYSMTLEIQTQGPDNGEAPGDGATGVQIGGHPTNNTCKSLLPLWSRGERDNQAFRNMIYNKQFNATIYLSRGQVEE
ncbi:MAG: hypothetical protein ACRC6N_04610, partial [Plesiomonas sp.]|uniref:hypothetical protein n=1 Tax=Plesiomonas sp. TaxID=2486279 RepID=UPI003F2B3379